jgi:hypothetical protein
MMATSSHCVVESTPIGKHFSKRMSKANQDSLIAVIGLACAFTLYLVVVVGCLVWNCFQSVSSKQESTSPECMYCNNSRRSISDDPEQVREDILRCPLHGCEAQIRNQVNASLPAYPNAEHRPPSYKSVTSE